MLCWGAVDAAKRPLFCAECEEVAAPNGPPLRVCCDAGVAPKRLLVWAGCDVAAPNKPPLCAGCDAVDDPNRPLLGAGCDEDAPKRPPLCVGCDIVLPNGAPCVAAGWDVAPAPWFANSEFVLDWVVGAPNVLVELEMADRYYDDP